jgi:hypothetical protein
MVAYGEGKERHNPSEDNNCHSKLMTTGLVKVAGRSGRPSTSQSEENVATVWETIFDSTEHNLETAASTSCSHTSLQYSLS